jgi:hypothetical protein
MCAKGMENVVAMQKEWLETVERTKREWVVRFETEGKLGSDFAAKVAAAKAISDVAAAYQEWIAHRIELISTDWQKIIQDGQNCVNACTRFAGNGRGLAPRDAELPTLHRW